MIIDQPPPIYVPAKPAIIRPAELWRKGIVPFFVPVPEAVGGANASVRASASFSTPDGSSGSGSVPAGTAIGDILLVCAACDASMSTGSGQGIQTPASHTLQNIITSASAGPGRHLAYFEIVSPVPTTISCVPGTGRPANVTMYAIENVNLTTPLDGTTTTATGTAVPNAPSYTTTNADVLRVIGAMVDDDSSTDLSVPDGTWGDFVIQTSTVGGSQDSISCMCTKFEATASTADDPAVFGGTASDAYIAWHLAFQSA